MSTVGQADYFIRSTRKHPITGFEAFQDNNIEPQYSFSNRINPFYQRADFDGDGKLDFAILINRRRQKKLDRFVPFRNRRDIILGAGNHSETRRKLYLDGLLEGLRKRESFQEPPHRETSTGPIGDALLVGQSESSSAILYWTGKIILGTTGD